MMTTTQKLNEEGAGHLVAFDLLRRGANVRSQEQP